MMQEKIINQISFSAQPQYLWFLTLSFCMIIVLANWVDSRLISIFGLDTDAGTLIFPLTFLISDLITEVYGYKHARRTIWCGFLFNFLFILYTQIIIRLPSPDYAINNEMIDTLLTLNARIILASAISYLIAEPFNSYVLAKLKIWLHGHYMGIRFVASTMLAAGLDSTIFGVLAFYNTLSLHNLFYLIVTMWFLKVMIEIIGLPISIRLAKKLKKIENLDIYDEKTTFTFFDLETNYTNENNQYKTTAFSNRPEHR